MAITTPRGFAGGPMADIDYGIGAAGQAFAESGQAFFVSQPNTGTRTVTVDAGTACAYGVRVTNDAPISQALAAPSSGGAWYLMALRFSWSAKTVTLQALPGPTTGATTAPTDIPTSMPATLANTLGTSWDMPLAWVFVNSANATATIFDVRMRVSNALLFGRTLQSLKVLGQQFVLVAGLTMPSYADGITYRWTNAGAWRAWDSDWIGFSPDVQAISGTAWGTPGWLPNGRYRWVSGKVRYEFSVSLNGGAVSTGGINLSLPVLMDQTSSQSITYQGGPTVAGAGHIRQNTTGRRYPVFLEFVNNNYIRMNVINSAFYLDGVGGNSPWAWGQSDSLQGIVEYDPA